VVEVPAGVGFALLFVPSQRCVPPLGVVIERGPDRIGPS
jgi:hypothetical protein